MCLANAKATVLTDIDLIMADIDKMPGGRAGMEQKLKKRYMYLHECLWVNIHPSVAVTPRRARQRARAGAGARARARARSRPVASH